MLEIPPLKYECSLFWFLCQSSLFLNVVSHCVITSDKRTICGCELKHTGLMSITHSTSTVCRSHNFFLALCFRS